MADYLDSFVDTREKRRLLIRLLSDIDLGRIIHLYRRCAIVNLNFVWNEFLFANVFLNDKTLQTIPIGLMTFKGDLRTDYTTTLAGLVIASLPLIILFFCMSKQFVKGLTAGAVKG